MSSPGNSDTDGAVLTAIRVLDSVDAQIAALAPPAVAPPATPST